MNHLEAIRKLLGVSDNVSRPLVCYVQDVIKEREGLRQRLQKSWEREQSLQTERDQYKSRMEIAEAELERLKSRLCPCEMVKN